MKIYSRKIWLACYAAIALLVFLGSYGDSQVAALDKSNYKALRTFTEVLDIVEKNYVEKVDMNTLVKEAINGMIKSLDPHSAFMTVEMFKELEVETKGSFGGIGIEITMQKDVLTVVSPIEDTPAFNAGIKAGDQIIMIDGQYTRDLTISDAVKKLRGKDGTKVTLTIMRDGQDKPKDYALVRAIIKVKSVKMKLLEKNIGYVRLAAFQERTTGDLKKALGELATQTPPVQGIVLDMRNNPGGLLNQAVEVSDLFMKSGTIVSTRGRTKNTESNAVARDNGDEPTCPMVILVNEGTASAAEIVAGALQDNGRALIIGTQTFGKGSVQTVIPLEDGSALKLTTAQYYTPNGRSIQAEGIAPDIVVKYVAPADTKTPTEGRMRERDLKRHIKSQKENEDQTPDMPTHGALRERDLKGHSKSLQEDSAQTPEAIPEEPDELTRDNQLKSAVDILKSWGIFKKTLKAG